MRVAIEADEDPGVPARVLDLLGVLHDEMPTTFSLACQGDGMVVRFRLAALPPRKCATMLAKLRQIPGVRRAEREDAAS